MNASKKDINTVKHNNFIAKAMDDAIKTQAEFYAKVHKVCVLVAYHAMRYGDNEGANIILEKLGNGTRKQGVVNWFGMFCGFKWDDKAGRFTDEINPDHIYQNMKAAKDKPWHQCMSKEKVVKPFDINADLNLALVHINKMKARKVEGDNPNVDMDLLRNLIVALGVDIMETIPKEQPKANAA